MSEIVAYVRVSTETQSNQNQLDEMKAKGYEFTANSIFEDVCSGSKLPSHREGFSRMVAYLREGDTVVIRDLTRLSRKTIDGLEAVKLFKEKGINIVILSMDIDTSKESGQLILTIFMGLAEYERSNLLARQKAGIARAKAEGVKFGAPLPIENFTKVQECKNAGLTIADTCRQTGLSRSSVNRHWNKMHTQRK